MPPPPSALRGAPSREPGASSGRALLSGKPLEGIWIDRTAQYRAWERQEPNPDARFTASHRLELSPLPCWDHLEPHQWQARVRAMVRDIEKETEGVQVLGARAICRQEPHDRPASYPRRTPAPRFHAVEPQVRRALEFAYRLMRNAYRQASEAWRAGRVEEFPPGCFVPGPFAPVTSPG